MCRANTHNTSWKTIDAKEAAFITKQLPFELSEIDMYWPDEKAYPSRRNLDGLWLFCVELQAKRIAFAWFDFRIKGGSLSSGNALRFNQFLDAIEEHNIPLIILCNSMGVRFTEGRKIFRDSFSVIPKLLNYKKSNLLITCASGPCFGLGAVLFGTGHYSITAREDTPVNLTGPEVFKLFFGSKIGIEDAASAPIQFRKTTLIDEIHNNLNEVLQKASELVLTLHYSKAINISKEKSHTQPSGSSAPSFEISTYALLSYISPDFIELYPNFSEPLKVFIIDVDGRRAGMLVNTRNNMNNMINVRCIRLINKALKLFEQLKLPLINIVDTPGIDPRIDGENSYIIENYISLADCLLNYPFRKVGIVFGRLYGGASILSLPNIFGGHAGYLVNGSEIGVMHESIVSELLSGSNKLKQQWAEAQQAQKEDYSDIIASGLVTDVIEVEDIPAIIAKELHTANDI